MKSTNSKTILVVGAGPTGLTLAAERARHGAPVRIIDRFSGIVRLSRVIGIHSRRLDVAQDPGIAGEVAVQAARVQPIRVFTTPGAR